MNRVGLQFGRRFRHIGITGHNAAILNTRENFEFVVARSIW